MKSRLYGDSVSFTARVRWPKGKPLTRGRKVITLISHCASISMQTKHHLGYYFPPSPHTASTPWSFSKGNNNSARNSRGLGTTISRACGIIEGGTARYIRRKIRRGLTQTRYFAAVPLLKCSSTHTHARAYMSRHKRNGRCTVYGIDIMLWYVDHHGPCSS